MPWTCVLCFQQSTYRRDRQCQDCRGSARGKHNKLVASVRLKTKSNLKSLPKKHVIYQQHMPPAQPSSREVLREKWQQSVEGEFPELLSDITSLSGRHSVLSHAHALVEGAAAQRCALPPVEPAYQLALMFCAMSFSTRLCNPDALRPKLAKTKAVDMKKVARAQSEWVNIMAQLDQSFIDC